MLLNINKVSLSPNNYFLIIIIALFTISNASKAQNWDYFVPDSILLECSDKTIEYNDYLTIMPLWPEDAPDNLNQHSIKESITYRNSCKNGETVNRAIVNVSKPGMLIFKALNSDTSTPCVIILPGGSNKRCVIDKEGIEVAKKFVKSGISAVIVKYRLFGDSCLNLSEHAIWSDTRRAVSCIRHKADEFNIDPNKIGVMGFSAGAFATSNLITNYDEIQVLLYDKISQTDGLPNFNAQIYGGIINKRKAKQFPPTFLLIAADDRPRMVEFTKRNYDLLIKNNIKAELKLFPEGGHGFGYGCNEGEISKWPDMFINWLISIDMLDKKYHKNINEQ